MSAALLSDAGLSVHVVERHHRLGGFTQTFRRGRFEWDVGVHHVGEVGRSSGRVRRVLDAVTDGALRWTVPGLEVLRVRVDERGYSLPAGRMAALDALADAFPHERRGIEAFHAAMRSAASDMRRWLFDHARGPAEARTQPTTASVLERCIASTDLRRLLTAAWGDLGVRPESSAFGAHAILAEHLEDGTSYPEGGGARIAHALAAGLRRRGVAITRAEVTGLKVERGRALGVRHADGSVIEAGVVVSAAGLRSTERWLGADAHRLALADTTTLPPSCGHLSVYLGLDGDAACLGLPTTDVIVDGEHDVRVLCGETVDLGNAFLASSAAKDPTYAARRPGGTTATVLFPVAAPRALAGGTWRHRDPDYEHDKRELARRAVELLASWAPATRDRVVHVEVSTPSTARHFTAHPRGESYGIACVPARFAPSYPAPRTPIEGLFVAGADACMPGVAGTVLGSSLAATAILGRTVVPFA